MGLDFARQISIDWRAAGLTPADRAMLDLCEKLTLSPGDVQEENIESLRSHGFADKEIFSIILAASYRNYIVRVADALGIELDPARSYPLEFRQAFGVGGTDLRNTLYADRMSRSEPEENIARRRFSQSIGRRRWKNQLSWIATEPLVEDSEKFRELSEELVRLSAPGQLQHLARVLALRPGAAKVIVEHMNLIGFNGSGLGRRLEAIIGLAVASTLSSSYMAVLHAHWLLVAGGTSDEVEKLSNCPSDAELSPEESRVASFCERLTRAPWTMVRSDVDMLRNSGFDDRAIIIIVACASFENFICRVVEGTGLPLEAEGLRPAAVRLADTIAKGDQHG